MALLEIHTGSEQGPNPSQVAPFEPHHVDYPALLVVGPEAGVVTRARELFDQFAAEYLSQLHPNISEEIAGLGVKRALANHHLVRNSVAGAHLVHVDCAPNAENHVVTMDLKRGEDPVRWHVAQRQMRHRLTHARIDILSLQSQPPGNTEASGGTRTAKLVLSMNPSTPDRIEFDNDGTFLMMSDVYELAERVAEFETAPDRVDVASIYSRAGHLSLLA